MKTRSYRLVYNTSTLNPKPSALTKDFQVWSWRLGLGAWAYDLWTAKRVRLGFSV